MPRFLLVPLIASIALAATPASASDRGALHFDALAGFGVDTIQREGDVTPTPDPFGLSIGARVGYTLPVGAYVGLSYVQQFGHSVDEILKAGATYHRDEATFTGPGTLTTRSRAALGGLELGWDIPIGSVLARPFLVTGVANRSDRMCVADACTTSTEGGFAWMAGLFLGTGVDRFEIGVEARYVSSSRPLLEGVTTLLSVGVRL